MMKLTKYSKWLLALSLSVLLVGCQKAQTTENIELQKATEEDCQALIVEPEEKGFAYRFDPTLNEAAMEDVVVDENAIYGFSPNPESERLGSYAEYDWSDPEVVEAGRQERIAYHESISSMYTMLDDLFAEGKDMETIARTISAERNRIRLASYEGDPEGLERVKKSNLEKYGDENGPSADSLFEKYGSWETVLTKAFSVNMGMDICLGLYDDYYSSYIELGLVPDVFGEMQNRNIPTELVKKYGSYRDDTFFIIADGNKLVSTDYLSSEDMYILDTNGDVYATVDNNLYYIADNEVYMYCFIGNAENPLLEDFEDSGDIDPDTTELAGIKKYSDDSILVTLNITSEDYLTYFEEMCGYSQGDIVGMKMKYLVSPDTYEEQLGELYVETANGSTKIGQTEIAYEDAQMPEVDSSILDTIRDKSRRDIKVIGDNGTKDEVVYQFDVGKKVHAALQLGDDYQPEIYEDAGYEKIYKGSTKLKKKVTLYIKKSL